MDLYVSVGALVTQNAGAFIALLGLCAFCRIGTTVVGWFR